MTDTSSTESMEGSVELNSFTEATKSEKERTSSYDEEEMKLLSEPPVESQEVRFCLHYSCI